MHACIQLSPRLSVDAIIFRVGNTIDIDIEYVHEQAAR
jgi:hypothetical protein